MQHTNPDTAASITAPAKWEGTARVDLAGVKAEQIWPLLEDFCGLKKWLPSLEFCDLVEGINGKPGCVRYCGAQLNIPVVADENGGGDQLVVNWAKEKLLFMDPVNMEFTYNVTEGNIGFRDYLATIKVLGKEDGAGCSIEWKYEVEPVQGWKLENLDFLIRNSLKGMAERMIEALRPQS